VPDDATRVIAALNAGDRAASAELMPLVYHELRRLARAQMSNERGGHTLQATALVHEAYVRLLRDGAGLWENRGHFFAAAAEAMRRILVEHARRRVTLKRGGDRCPTDALAEDELPVIESPVDRVDDLIALDEALTALAAHDPPTAQLVKLLFFAGLSLGEAAAVVGISRATAHRHWLYARAWLFDAMRPSDP
jgi:RNA polymerase sigma factor (TIGR02999 family)